MSSGDPDTAPVIAVVDDDEDVRTAMGDLLMSLGYSARMFETADAFLLSDRQPHISCVISDVQMPGTNGLQLARLMRRAKVPIILITAFPTPEIERQAEGAKVRKLLVKPFDSRDLIAELDLLRL